MAKAHTIDELKGKINFMDCLSQEGFSKIQGISNLAVKALDNSKNSDTVNAFKAISGISMDIMNCINGEAENVGCNYKRSES